MGRLKIVAFLSVAILWGVALAAPAPACAGPHAQRTKSIVVADGASICVDGTYVSRTEEPVMSAQTAIRQVQHALIRLSEADGVHFRIGWGQGSTPCSRPQDDLMIRVHTLIDRPNDRVTVTLTASGQAGTYSDSMRRDHAESWGVPKVNFIDPPLPADLWPDAAKSAIRLDTQTLTERLYRSLIIQKRKKSQDGGPPPPHPL